MLEIYEFFTLIDYSTLDCKHVAEIMSECWCQNDEQSEREWWTFAGEKVKVRFRKERKE